MKTKGKQSVSEAIIKALTDTAKQCELNDVKLTFSKHLLFSRIREYVGSDYQPDDEMIGRRMRKIRQHGYLDRACKLGKTVLTYRIDYSYKGNGIYLFNL